MADILVDFYEIRDKKESTRKVTIKNSNGFNFNFLP